jgi:DinB superfamily
MKEQFKVLETNRHLYLNFLEKYTLEQLNTTPKGFSNNLIWNIGHIIVVQQSLTYRKSSLPMNISGELFNQYTNGTKPTGMTTQTEMEELKSLLLPLVEKTKEDFAKGKFVTYTEYTTHTGFHLGSTHDAIAFNNYHEGLHLGCMMNICKFV